jgi:ribosomal protein S18 acetylase RimI-like enzyme
MITYTDFQEKDETALRTLIKDLYTEDSECTAISEEKITKTICYLKDHPEMGKILLFRYTNTVIGYSVLIHFWSNEYGGLVVHIDELYVVKEYRNRNVATGFINYLADSHYKNAVALFLEVTLSNHNAYRLYKRLNFNEPERRFMIRML